MKKLHVGLFILLLLLAAVIAPTTYNTVKKITAGKEAAGYINIDHAAHHGGAVQYTGGN